MGKEIKAIKGIVVATTEQELEKGKRYGIKLKAKEMEEPIWFNGFGALPEIEEGDVVIIKYTEKKGENEIFRNIKDIKKISEEQKTIDEIFKEHGTDDMATKTMAVGVALELARCKAYNFPEFQDFIRLCQLIEAYLKNDKILSKVIK